MQLNFNVTGAERKALVAAVSEITGEAAVYMKAPSFAYAVQNYSIDKTGALSWDERTDAQDRRNLAAQLAERGFVSEIPIETDAAAPDRLTIEMPLEGFGETAFANLEKLVASKAALIRKGVGADDLSIRRESDRLCFSWFSPDASAEEIHAYTLLVTALCERAKTQKRITAREKTGEEGSEKFAFRCFLLRLGFIGPEYASARKILLRNLPGDSSFKNGKRVPEKPAGDATGSTGEGERHGSLVRGGLCLVPPTDCNYVSYLRDATDAQLREAIAIMEAAPQGHKGRLAACNRELTKRNAN